MSSLCPLCLCGEGFLISLPLPKQVVEIDLDVGWCDASRGGESDPAAHKNDTDPQQQREDGCQLPACGRCHVVVPLMFVAAGPQLEDQHVDSGKRDQHHL